MAVTKLCSLHQTYSVDEKIMERTETCRAPAFKNISKLGLSTPEADIQAQSVKGWQQEPLCYLLSLGSFAAESIVGKQFIGLQCSTDCDSHTSFLNMGVKNCNPVITALPNPLHQCQILGC